MAKRAKLTGDFETVDEIVRPERARKYKYLFLIVCEDENTERIYFERFKNKIPQETIFLKPIGTGRDQKGVVEQAIIEKDNLEQFCKRDVDEVWVVFDKDDADQNPAKIERFEQAFEIGRAKDFKFAFSNEVFELWLLLHLTDVDPNTPLPRAYIYQELQRIVRMQIGHEDFVYIHGHELILEKIAILGDEQAAFQRAETLVKANGTKSKISANPITFVGDLIKTLYEWINFFSYD